MRTTDSSFAVYGHSSVPNSFASSPVGTPPVCFSSSDNWFVNKTDCSIILSLTGVVKNPYAKKKTASITDAITSQNGFFLSKINALPNSFTTSSFVKSFTLHSPLVVLLVVLLVLERACPLT